MLAETYNLNTHLRNERLATELNTVCLAATRACRTLLDGSTMTLDVEEARAVMHDASRMLLEALDRVVGE
jgi:hypothetical protein